MSSPVEQIKERLSIVDVVGGYIKLEKAGANFKAKCPFHTEKTPSFFVSPDRGSYYCFGCGAKGDVFSFVETFEGLDFRGALKSLAGRAGVELVPENKNDTSRKERLFYAVEEAATFFENELSKNALAKFYMLSRGITEKTMANFRIGFALDEWRTLKNHLENEKFNAEELILAGLCKKNEKGDAYDVFRGRIMFPIGDSSGRIVAFSGRTMDEEKNPPKYLNTPETELYSKSRILFGLDKAKTSIRKFDHAILVEGQMDLVMSHQAGFTNTIAASGTAIGDLTLITRLSKNLKIAFDPDLAGVKAALRAATIAISLGMDVKIVKNETNEDPADIIKKDPKEWQKILGKATDVVSFLTDQILKSENDRKRISKRVPIEVLPFIALMDKSTDKAHFVKLVSEKTGIREDALWQDLKSLPKDIWQIKEKEDVLEKRPVQSLERRLIGVFHLLKRSFDDIPEIKKLYEEMPKSERSEVAFEAEVMYDAKDLERVANELLLHVEEERLSASLDSFLRDLEVAEKEKNVEKAKMILKKLSGISKRINEIKQSIRSTII